MERDLNDSRPGRSAGWSSAAYRQRFAAPPKNGSRVMLYAGERQNVPIVAHGPLVGETHADLVRVSRAYAEGPYAARQ
jgi:redox-sensitive bicupin YhaK (pirin superfamily)